MNDSKRRRRHAAGLALAGTASIMIMTGCGGAGMGPTMTARQAMARVEEVVAETGRHLPPGATLKQFGSGLGTMPCEGSDGPVFAENTYQVEYPPGWPADQALPRLEAFWKERGFKVVSSSRARDLDALSVQYPDGFRAGVKVWHRDNGGTDIYIGGSSPCVWENGTPEPA